MMYLRVIYLLYVSNILLLYYNDILVWSGYDTNTHHAHQPQLALTISETFVVIVI